MNAEDLEQIRTIVREELDRGKAKRKAAPTTWPELKEVWLSKYPEYIWGAVDGANLKQLQAKLMVLCGNEKLNAIESFRAMLWHLPTWFEGRGIQIINSKFNDIVHEIKRTNPAAKAEQVKNSFRSYP